MSYSKFLSPETIACNIEDIFTMGDITPLAMEFIDQCLPIKGYVLIKELLESIEDKNSNNKLQELESFLSEYELLFSEEERVLIYSYMNNYVIKRTNVQKDIYHKQYIRYSAQIINLKYSKEKGKLHLPPAIFKNIVFAALKINEIEFFNSIYLKEINGLKPDDGWDNNLVWTELFIESYKDFLNNQFRGIYYPYCKAFILFVKGEFEEAYYKIGLCAGISEMFMNFHIKTLKTQILFELIFTEKPLKNLKKVRLEVELKKSNDQFRKQLVFEENNRQQLRYHLKHFQDFYTTFKNLLKFQKKSVKSNDQNRQELLKNLDLFKKSISKESPPCKNWFMTKISLIQKK